MIILTSAGDWGHWGWMLFIINDLWLFLEGGKSNFRGYSGDCGGIFSTCENPIAIIDITSIIDGMASIVIRNLDEATKRKLKIRAATNGRSMEQEAREILKSALAQGARKKAHVAERIREIFDPVGGVELERLPREPVRDPDWLAQRE